MDIITAIDTQGSMLNHLMNNIRGKPWPARFCKFRESKAPIFSFFARGGMM